MAQLGNLIVNGVTRLLSKLYVNGSVTAPEFIGKLTGKADTAGTADKLSVNAGTATQPVYFSGGKPVATTYSLNKTVPADAKFTDTNTWRGVQNNLTSTATDQSLSAAQGKVLKDLVDGKAAASHIHSQYYDANISRTANTVLAAPNGSNGGATFRKLVTADLPSHTHTKSQITDFPASLKNPTSLTIQTNGNTAATYDGSAEKTVNITKSSIGLGNVDNTADANKSVKYATSAGSAPFLSKNTTFNKTGQAGIQYYDADIRSATSVSTDGWGSPTEAWYQIIHMPLSVSGYFNDIALPVNDVNGIAYRQRRSGAYYGWYRLLDSNNWKTYVTKSALGLDKVANTADADKSVKSATTATQLSSSAGSATQPVYFKDGKPVAGTYTLGKSVPSDAKFTDTNTWRGIQNNLTSTSTTDSLSAAQGKVLKDLVDTKAASGHTHNYAGSSSAGGAANSANKLNTNAGSATQPVYFKDGIPAATTYALNKTVPADAKFTDTTYGTFKGATSNAAGGSGLVPAPVAGAQTKYLRADGTWQTPPDTNTTYKNMVAATSSAAGSSGLVPAPAAGAQGKYLRGDGTWQTPANTWRGIQNNLTSDSTTDSLSAAQGKTLKTLVDSKSPSNHVHNYAGSSSAGGAATSSIVAQKLARNGNTANPMTFNWSEQSGQPTWLWGGNDASNMYVWNPSNFSVKYANSARSANVAQSVSIDAVYPVGSIYQSTSSTSPAKLFGGTWESISTGRVLMGVNNEHAAGSTVEAGLPNITGKLTEITFSKGKNSSDCFALENIKQYEVLYGFGVLSYIHYYADVSFSASSSNNIYGSSNTVQPPAYFVYIWRRIE